MLTTNDIRRRIGENVRLITIVEFLIHLILTVATTQCTQSA